MPDIGPPLPRRLRPIASGAALTVAALALTLGSRGWRDGVRMALVCALGVAWVVARQFVRSRPGRCSMLVALVALVAGTYATDLGPRLVQLWQRGVVRPWNLYHYYLGAKYFDEVGFSDLYRMTVLADREGSRRIRGLQQMRDLSDYRVKSASVLLPRERSAGFTDARWQSFREDVEQLTRRVRRSKWAGMLVDRGYNPTPFYTVMVRPLTNAVHLDRWGQVVALCSIDVALYVVLLVALVWGFGWEAALLSMLAFAVLPFNRTRLIGNVVQYDWLVGLGVAAALLRRGRFAAAGAVAGYAALVRVFPLILASAVAVPALVTVLRQHALPRRYLAFALAFALVGAAGIGMGCQTERGFGAWREFAVKIQQHNREMTYGDGRVGLKHLFTHSIGSPRFESTAQRRTVLEEQWGLYVTAATTFLVAALALLVVVRDWEALILGSLVLFALIVPSHYYWSVLALVPLVRPRDDGAPGWLGALVAFVPIAGWYQYSLSRPQEYASYIRFDLLLWIALFVLAVWTAARDRRIPQRHGTRSVPRAAA